MTGTPSTDYGHLFDLSITDWVNDQMTDVEGYDIPGIVADYHAAIQDRLPDGVTLFEDGSMVGPYPYQDGGVVDVLESIDFWAIVERHRARYSEMTGAPADAIDLASAIEPTPAERIRGDAQRLADAIDAAQEFAVLFEIYFPETGGTRARFRACDTTAAVLTLLERLPNIRLSPDDAEREHEVRDVRVQICLPLELRAQAIILTAAEFTAAVKAARP